MYSNGDDISRLLYDLYVLICTGRKIFGGVIYHLLRGLRMTMFFFLLGVMSMSKSLFFPFFLVNSERQRLDRLESALFRERLLDYHGHSIFGEVDTLSALAMWLARLFFFFFRIFISNDARFFLLVFHLQIFSGIPFFSQFQQAVPLLT